MSERETSETHQTDAADEVKRADSEAIDQAAYWRANLRIMASLLLIWFGVSFGCGILFVDVLNEIQFFGWRLGFWFSQQGAIYVFVLLIFAYVALMNRLDRRFGLIKED
jgi:putative solute:sodium symporter small subunit